MPESVFAKLSDDVVLNILHKLDDDPRNWARVACVSTKFSSLIRTICCKAKCSRSIPAVVSDLLSPAELPPPDVWASLYKLSVCCPGLVNSGVLLDHSDSGLERHIGPDEDYLDKKIFLPIEPKDAPSSSRNDGEQPEAVWSLYDDLLFETLHADSEALERADEKPEIKPDVGEIGDGKPEFSACKKRKTCRPLRSHLAPGIWNLSREQGNKLLAARFKGDCLYICDWPGCIHVEEKRNYMLFRGIFKDFKQSRVWRTINNGSRSKIDLHCAYCSSNQTWGLHSSFCLRRYFGFHDDGEPVVRAYVCENGHVSGAWTDWPLYT
ncbi:Phytochrome A-associated F-box protein [Striga hermonthica]|uniref:Phytochrome A-associated F-box protein n=1 Tax=Striga hermonthica TaxID=68872 RepID=A0A9N7NGA1_STRHE|nr:Phytochrome A-associated F-box protein [Striga hermonthica]